MLQSKFIVGLKHFKPVWFLFYSISYLLLHQTVKQKKIKIKLVWKILSHKKKFEPWVLVPIIRQSLLSDSWGKKVWNAKRKVVSQLQLLDHGQQSIFIQICWRISERNDAIFTCEENGVLIYYTWKNPTALLKFKKMLKTWQHKLWSSTKRNSVPKWYPISQLGYVLAVNCWKIVL